MSLKKKALNNNLVISTLVGVIRFYIWFVYFTSRVIVEIDKQSDVILNSKMPAILLSWHNRILLAPKMLQRFGKLYAVVSMHNDGDYLSKFITSYGHGVIRGSSKKGAVAAMIGLRNALNDNGVVMITPDGPRGPREKINSNVVGMIKKFNVPALFVSYSCSKKITCNSWDKFIIPLPFSKIYFVINTITPNQNYFDTNEYIEKYMIEKNDELDNNIIL